MIGDGNHLIWHVLTTTVSVFLVYDTYKLSACFSIFKIMEHVLWLKLDKTYMNLPDIGEFLINLSSVAKSMHDLPYWTQLYVRFFVVRPNNRLA